MRQKIRLQSGKEIEFPARIFTKKELDEMGVDFVEGKIFFNKAKPREDFQDISKNIKENMAVINYTDCSNINFSEEILKDSLSKQIKSDSDFIILPYFRNESDYDVKTKIEYAERIKLKSVTTKEIILELSYKSGIPPKELNDLSHNFDYLAVFYGVSYGHYPSFEKVIKRVVSFKAMTGKKVLCIAVPLKFSGENNQDCRFMPSFNLVSDMWLKNWRKSGGNNKIKVIDPEDLKSKDYTGWLESGYFPNTNLTLVNRTVYDLFRKDNQRIRNEFEQYILDGVLNEVNNLEPGTVEDYIYQRFYSKYSVLLIIAYRERVIVKLFKDNKIFNKYDESERLLLERKIRKYYNPLKVERLLLSLTELATREEKVPIAQLVKKIDDFGIGT